MTKPLVPTPHNNPGKQNADAWFTRFVGLLESQRALLGELDGLSQRQRGLIDSDDAEGLLHVLRDRQGVIDRLLAAQTEVDRMRAQWAGVEEGLGEARVVDVRARMDELAALHDAIMARDDEDQSSLRRRRDQIATELADLGNSRRALGAYAPVSPQSPRFHDSEG